MANETWEKIKSDVLRDAKQYIDDNVEYYADEDFDEDNLYDDLFMTDQVCGNGSFRHQPMFSDEFLAKCLFDEDVIDILHDLFSTIDTEICERIIGQGIGGKEYLDTSLRCVALGCVMDDVIEHFHKVVKANKANEE